MKERNPQKAIANFTLRSDGRLPFQEAERCVETPIGLLCGLLKNKQVEISKKAK